MFAHGLISARGHASSPAPVCRFVAHVRVQLVPLLARHDWVVLLTSLSFGSFTGSFRSQVRQFGIDRGLVLTRLQLILLTDLRAWLDTARGVE